MLSFSIHDPINIVDKEAFEVTCPVHKDIGETVKKKIEKIRENGKKHATVWEKLKQVNIMSETMSPYTYLKETGIQQISIDCHVLLSTKTVENSLVLSY